MSRARKRMIAAVVLLGSGIGSAQAGGWSVGIRLGVPVYVGPCYGCYRPYYYRPYPVFVEAAPVFIQPVPVVQPVLMARPVYQSVAPPVAPEALPAAPQAVAPVAAAQPRMLNQQQLDSDNHLRQLADPSEKVREDAVLHLGRVRALRAVDPLAATLAGDASPAVREAAARSLGLIGSPKALPALRRAAQADTDRDVRHSAQFAVEVVQVTKGN